MAITDPQAVRFCNEKIRSAADNLAQAYNHANRVVNEWTSFGGVALIPNDAGEDVIDGSATDGRPPITGADVNNIINRLSERLTDYEAGGNAKLNTILRVAPNQGL